MEWNFLLKHLLVLTVFFIFTSGADMSSTFTTSMTSKLGPEATSSFTTTHLKQSSPDPGGSQSTLPNASATKSLDPGTPVTSFPMGVSPNSTAPMSVEPSKSSSMRTNKTSPSSPPTSKVAGTGTSISVTPAPRWGESSLSPGPMSSRVVPSIPPVTSSPHQGSRIDVTSDRVTSTDLLWSTPLATTPLKVDSSPTETIPSRLYELTTLTTRTVVESVPPSKVTSVPPLSRTSASGSSALRAEMNMATSAEGPPSQARSSPSLDPTPFQKPLSSGIFPETTAHMSLGPVSSSFPTSTPLASWASTASPDAMPSQGATGTASITAGSEDTAGASTQAIITSMAANHLVSHPQETTVRVGSTPKKETAPDSTPSTSLLLTSNKAGTLPLSRTSDQTPSTSNLLATVSTANPMGSEKGSLETSKLVTTPPMDKTRAVETTASSSLETPATENSVSEAGTDSTVPANPTLLISTVSSSDTPGHLGTDEPTSDPLEPVNTSNPLETSVETVSGETDPGSTTPQPTNVPESISTSSHGSGAPTEAPMPTEISTQVTTRHEDLSHTPLKPTVAPGSSPPLEASTLGIVSSILPETISSILPAANPTAGMITGEINPPVPTSLSTPVDSLYSKVFGGGVGTSPKVTWIQPTSTVMKTTSPTPERSKSQARSELSSSTLSPIALSDVPIAVGGDIGITVPFTKTATEGMVVMTSSTFSKPEETSHTVQSPHPSSLDSPSIPWTERATSLSVEKTLYSRAVHRPSSSSDTTTKTQTSKDAAPSTESTEVLVDQESTSPILVTSEKTLKSINVTSGATRVIEAGTAGRTSFSETSLLSFPESSDSTEVRTSLTTSSTRRPSSETDLSFGVSKSEEWGYSTSPPTSFLSVDALTSVVSNGAEVTEAFSPTAGPTGITTSEKVISYLGLGATTVGSLGSGAPTGTISTLGGTTAQAETTIQVTRHEDPFHPPLKTTVAPSSSPPLETSTLGTVSSTSPSASPAEDPMTGEFPHSVSTPLSTPADALYTKIFGGGAGTSPKVTWIQPTSTLLKTTSPTPERSKSQERSELGSSPLPPIALTNAPVAIGGDTGSTVAVTEQTAEDRTAKIAVTFSELPETSLTTQSPRSSPLDPPSIPWTEGNAEKTVYSRAVHGPSSSSDPTPKAQNSKDAAPSTTAPDEQASTSSIFASRGKTQKSASESSISPLVAKGGTSDTETGSEFIDSFYTKVFEGGLKTTPRRTWSYQSLISTSSSVVESHKSLSAPDTNVSPFSSETSLSTDASTSFRISPPGTSSANSYTALTHTLLPSIAAIKAFMTLESKSGTRETSARAETQDLLLEVTANGSSPPRVPSPTPATLLTTIGDKQGPSTHSAELPSTEGPRSPVSEPLLPTTPDTGLSSRSPDAVGTGHASPASGEDPEPTSLPVVASSMGTSTFRSPAVTEPVETAPGSASAQASSFPVGSASGSPALDTTPASMSSPVTEDSKSLETSATGTMGTDSLPQVPTSGKPQAVPGSSTPFPSGSQGTVSSLFPTASPSADTTAAREPDSTEPADSPPGSSFPPEFSASGQTSSHTLSPAPSHPGFHSQVPEMVPTSIPMHTETWSTAGKPESETGPGAISSGPPSTGLSQSSSPEAGGAATDTTSMAGSTGTLLLSISVPVSTASSGTPIPTRMPSPSTGSLETSWPETRTSPFSPNVGHGTGSASTRLLPSASLATGIPVGMTGQPSLGTPMPEGGASAAASLATFPPSGGTQRSTGWESSPFLLHEPSPTGSETTRDVSGSRLPAQTSTLRHVPGPTAGPSTDTPDLPPWDHSSSVPVTIGGAETPAGLGPRTAAGASASSDPLAHPGEGATVSWFSSPAEAAMGVLSTSLDWLRIPTVVTPEAPSESSTLGDGGSSAVPGTERTKLTPSSQSTVRRATPPASASSVEIPTREGGAGAAASVTASLSVDSTPSGPGNGAPGSASLAISSPGDGSRTYELSATASETTSLHSLTTSPVEGSTREVPATVTREGTERRLSQEPPTSPEVIPVSSRDTAPTATIHLLQEVSLGPSTEGLPVTDLPTMTETTSPSAPGLAAEASSASPLAPVTRLSPSATSPKSTAETRGASWARTVSLRPTHFMTETSRSGLPTHADRAVSTFSENVSEETASISAAPLVTATGSLGSTEQESSPTRSGLSTTEWNGSSLSPPLTSVSIISVPSSQSPSSGSGSSPPTPPDTSFANALDSNSSPGTSLVSVQSSEAAATTSGLSHSYPGSSAEFMPSSTSWTKSSAPGMATSSGSPVTFPITTGSETNIKGRTAGPFTPYLENTEPLWTTVSSHSGISLPVDVSSPSGMDESLSPSTQSADLPSPARPRSPASEPMVPTMPATVAGMGESLSPSTQSADLPSPTRPRSPASEPMVPTMPVTVAGMGESLSPSTQSADLPSPARPRSPASEPMVPTMPATVAGIDESLSPNTQSADLPSSEPPRSPASEPMVPTPPATVADTGLSSRSPDAVGTGHASPASGEDPEPTSLPVVASSMGTSTFRSPAVTEPVETAPGSASAQASSFSVGSASGSPALDTTPASMSSPVTEDPKSLETSATGTMGTDSRPKAPTPGKPQVVPGSSTPLPSGSQGTVSSLSPMASSSADTTAARESDSTEPADSPPGSSFPPEFSASGQTSSHTLSPAPSHPGFHSQVPEMVPTAIPMHTGTWSTAGRPESETGPGAISSGPPSTGLSQSSSPEAGGAATGTASMAGSTGTSLLSISVPVSTASSGTPIPTRMPSPSTGSLETSWPETRTSPFSPGVVHKGHSMGSASTWLLPSASLATGIPVGTTGQPSLGTPMPKGGASAAASLATFPPSGGTQRSTGGESTPFLLHQPSPTGSETTRDVSESRLPAQTSTLRHVPGPTAGPSTDTPDLPPWDHSSSVPVTIGGAETPSGLGPRTTGGASASSDPLAHPGEGATVSWFSSPAEAAMGVLSTSLDWLRIPTVVTPEAPSESSTLGDGGSSAVPGTERTKLTPSSQSTVRRATPPASASSMEIPTREGGAGAAASVTASLPVDSTPSGPGNGAPGSASLAISSPGDGSRTYELSATASETTSLHSLTTSSVEGSTREVPATVRREGTKGGLSQEPPTSPEDIPVSSRDTAPTGTSPLLQEVSLGPSTEALPVTDLPTMTETTSPSAPGPAAEASSASPLAPVTRLSPSATSPKSTAETFGASWAGTVSLGPTNFMTETSRSGLATYKDRVVATFSEKISGETASVSASPFVTATGSLGSTEQESSPTRSGLSTTEEWNGSSLSPPLTRVSITSAPSSQSPSSGSGSSPPMPPDTSFANALESTSSPGTSLVSVQSSEAAATTSGLSHSYPGSSAEFMPPSTAWTKSSAPGMATSSRSPVTFPFTTGSETNSKGRTAGPFTPYLGNTEPLWTTVSSHSGISLPVDVSSPSGMGESLSPSTQSADLPSPARPRSPANEPMVPTMPVTVADTGLSSRSPDAIGTGHASPVSGEDPEPTSLPVVASSMGISTFRSPAVTEPVETAPGSASAQASSFPVGSASESPALDTTKASMSSPGTEDPKSLETSANGTMGTGFRPQAPTPGKPHAVPGSSTPLPSGSQGTVSSLSPMASPSADTTAARESDSMEPADSPPGSSFPPEFSTSGQTSSHTLSLAPSQAGFHSQVPEMVPTAIPMHTGTWSTAGRPESEMRPGAISSRPPSTGLSQSSSPEAGGAATDTTSMAGSTGTSLLSISVPVSTASSGTPIPTRMPSPSTGSLETWSETRTSLFSPGGVHTGRSTGSASTLGEGGSSAVPGTERTKLTPSSQSTVRRATPPASASSVEIPTREGGAGAAASVTASLPVGSTPSGPGSGAPGSASLAVTSPGEGSRAHELSATASETTSLHSLTMSPVEGSSREIPATVTREGTEGTLSQELPTSPGDIPVSSRDTAPTGTSPLLQEVSLGPSTEALPITDLPTMTETTSPSAPGPAAEASSASPLAPVTRLSPSATSPKSTAETFGASWAGTVSLGPTNFMTETSRSGLATYKDRVVATFSEKISGETASVSASPFVTATGSLGSTEQESSPTRSGLSTIEDWNGSSLSPPLTSISITSVPSSQSPSSGSWSSPPMAPDTSFSDAPDSTSSPGATLVSVQSLGPAVTTPGPSNSSPGSSAEFMPSSTAWTKSSAPGMVTSSRSPVTFSISMGSEKNMKGRTAGLFTPYLGDTVSLWTTVSSQSGTSLPVDVSSPLGMGESLRFSTQSADLPSSTGPRSPASEPMVPTTPVTVADTDASVAPVSHIPDQKTSEGPWASTRDSQAPISTVSPTGKEPDVIPITQIPDQGATEGLAALTSSPPALIDTLSTTGSEVAIVPVTHIPDHEAPGEKEVLTTSGPLVPESTVGPVDAETETFTVETMPATTTAQPSLLLTMATVKGDHSPATHRTTMHSPTEASTPSETSLGVTMGVGSPTVSMTPAELTASTVSDGPLKVNPTEKISSTSLLDTLVSERSPRESHSTTLTPWPTAVDSIHITASPPGMEISSMLPLSSIPAAASDKETTPSLDLPMKHTPSEQQDVQTVTEQGSAALSSTVSSIIPTSVGGDTSIFLVSTEGPREDKTVSSTLPDTPGITQTEQIHSTSRGGPDRSFTSSLAPLSEGGSYARTVPSPSVEGMTSPAEPILEFTEPTLPEEGTPSVAPVTEFSTTDSGKLQSSLDSTSTPVWETSRPGSTEASDTSTLSPGKFHPAESTANLMPSPMGGSSPEPAVYTTLSHTSDITTETKLRGETDLSSILTTPASAVSIITISEALPGIRTGVPWSLTSAENTDITTDITMIGKDTMSTLPQTFSPPSPDILSEVTYKAEDMSSNVPRTESIKVTDMTSLYPKDTTNQQFLGTVEESSTSVSLITSSLGPPVSSASIMGEVTNMSGTTTDSMQVTTTHGIPNRDSERTSSLPLATEDTDNTSTAKMPGNISVLPTEHSTEDQMSSALLPTTSPSSMALSVPRTVSPSSTTAETRTLTITGTDSISSSTPITSSGVTPFTENMSSTASRTDATSLIFSTKITDIVPFSPMVTFRPELPSMVPEKSTNSPLTTISIKVPVFSDTNPVGSLVTSVGSTPLETTHGVPHADLEKTSELLLTSLTTETTESTITSRATEGITSASPEFNTGAEMSSAIPSTTSPAEITKISEAMTSRDISPSSMSPGVPTVTPVHIGSDSSLASVTQDKLSKTQSQSILTKVPQESDTEFPWSSTATEATKSVTITDSTPISEFQESQASKHGTIPGTEASRNYPTLSPSESPMTHDTSPERATSTDQALSTLPAEKLPETGTSSATFVSKMLSDVTSSEPWTSTEGFESQSMSILEMETVLAISTDPAMTFISPLSKTTTPVSMDMETNLPSWAASPSSKVETTSSLVDITVEETSQGRGTHSPIHESPSSSPGPSSALTTPETWTITGALENTSPLEDSESAGLTTESMRSSGETPTLDVSLPPSRTQEILIASPSPTSMATEISSSRAETASVSAQVPSTSTLFTSGDAGVVPVTHASGHGVPGSIAALTRGPLIPRSTLIPTGK
ncbi:mucin-17-like [Antechinus flavipes]|uniref:mucin-17-like n=1 Tax=Antechinus flavipes TaxID=38775 RepID=UPI002236B1D0|nr:mucin-17-like [Antechinus flavipes]